MTQVKLQYQSMKHYLISIKDKSFRLNQFYPFKNSFLLKTDIILYNEIRNKIFFTQISLNKKICKTIF